jgi:MinD superfamily P-loop ATPase
MKEIVIVSGKGGTGKTMLTASFAALSKNAAFADCDVDAANLHILLNPTIIERYEFKGGKVAIIDKEKCKRCGACFAVCRFDAIVIKGFTIDPLSCEGCGVCAHICPEKAIKMEDKVSGEWFISKTKYGPFVHAKLAIAEENSGKLVSVVRQNTKSVAEKENRDLIIIDGPPGIGCPVISSITNTDIVLVVTEPTLSGMHDMARVAELAKHFKIKTFVVINKYDLNLEMTEEIEKYCQKNRIPLAGRINYDSKIPEAIVNKKIVVEYTDGIVARQIKNIWETIYAELN